MEAARRAMTGAVLASLLALASCQQRLAVAPADSIVSPLLAALRAEDSARYATAALLLAHVELADGEVGEIRAELANTTSDHKKLFLAYLLAVRLQEVADQGEFVRLYPVGAGQRLVWDEHGKYVCASSPLQDYLAELARTDDAALEKLVSGLPFADGADAEALVDQVRAIHASKPEAVRLAMKRLGIDLSRAGLE